MSCALVDNAGAAGRVMKWPRCGEYDVSVGQPRKALRRLSLLTERFAQILQILSLIVGTRNGHEVTRGSSANASQTGVSDPVPGASIAAFS